MSRPGPTDAAAGRAPRALGAKGEATRQRLLAAAEEIFSVRGYHTASISDITREAGVAQGTFYLYFDSKLAVFQAVVRGISHQLRRATTEAIQAVSDRREAERRGIEAFFQFLQERPNIYRVLREAEFVDPELFQWYYSHMAEGYQRRLAEAQALGQVRQADPEVLAWCLMGISHMLGLRYVVWDGGGADLAHVMQTAMDFLNAGINPEPGRGGDPTR